MLDVAIQTLLKFLAIIGIATAIVILLAIIFSVLGGIRQIREQDKFEKIIKDEKLKDAKRVFDKMIKDLEDQEPKL